MTLVLAACGALVTPSPTTVPTATLIATLAVTGSPESSGSPTATPAVALDPSLLGVLPASVSGFAVVESPEAETAALGDPQLAKVGTAMVAGIAVDATVGEFVYAVVVRLRPGTMTDAVFRDWRDSYDQGACSQASGVSGNAQTQIDGRTVYIGTCTGGVRTYHVWIPERQLLVSASSVGDRRFGETLMENLRP